MLETIHQRKSMAITVTAHVVLILLLLFFGFTYLDPPEENGIAVNFGTSEVGSGNIQPTTPVRTAPQEQVVSPVEAVPEPSSAQAKPEETAVEEEVVTQESQEAIALKKKQEADRKAEADKKAKAAAEAKAEAERIAKKQREEAEKKRKLDALIGGVASSEGASGGEGDTNQPGDKGSPDGDPNAKSYYGSGVGLDGDGNYRLKGRKALSKKKYVQDCNEAGIVVVQIEVDQNGRVIRATPGVKGTTNNAACLINPAKRAALATTFNADSKAPSKQVGTIIYEFRLSD